jgi:putative redox protein
MGLVKVSMERIGEPFLFESTDASGNKVHIDAAPAIGGTGKGVRPMEMLLMGLAGCSGIDVVNILTKQRQKIDTLRVNVEGVRGEGDGATPFEDIRVKFALTGTIEESHLQRALELTFEKYCSVAKTLEKAARISWEYTLNAPTSSEDRGPKRVAGQVP